MELQDSKSFLRIPVSLHALSIAKLSVSNAADEARNDISDF